MAAACEVFAEQGYTAASISKMAKKANVLSGQFIDAGTISTTPF
ncbi:TetR family transcriptional regulator [Paraburkholderia sp. 31.1]